MLNHFFKIIKKPAILMAVFIVTGCNTSTRNEYFVDASSKNAQDGNKRIYFRMHKGLYAVWVKPPVRLYAEGRFLNGVPEGTWSIFQECQRKEADLNFANGRVDGEIHTYAPCDNSYRSTEPAEGYYKNGVPYGNFKGPVFAYPKKLEYVDVSMQVENGNIVSILSGDPELAQELLKQVKSQVDNYVNVISHINDYPGL